MSKRSSNLDCPGADSLGSVSVSVLGDDGSRGVSETRRWPTSAVAELVAVVERLVPYLRLGGVEEREGEWEASRLAEDALRLYKPVLRKGWESVMPIKPLSEQAWDLHQWIARDDYLGEADSVRREIGILALIVSQLAELIEGQRNDA